MFQLKIGNSPYYVKWLDDYAVAVTDVRRFALACKLFTALKIKRLYKSERLRLVRIKDIKNLE